MLSTKVSKMWFAVGKRAISKKTEKANNCKRQSG